MIPRKVECILTEEQLRERCKYWQEVLRLQDWDVMVRLARGNGLDLPADSQGRCNWSEQRRSALIRVVDHADYDREIIHPQNHEETLVHELLHLKCAPFDTFKEDTAENTAMEQMIVSVAAALVHLDREFRQRVDDVNSSGV